MKKNLSFVLAVLMFLSLAVTAFSDDADLIPGTEFPMPDAVTSVKTVDFDQLQEKTILELLGVDMLFDLCYADTSTASQALEEYRSGMEQRFPGLTDSKGNVLHLPDSTSAPNFSITLNLKKEPVSYIGMESIGWFDISSYNDVLTEIQYSEIENRMGVSPKESLALIQCELLSFGEEKPDFDYVRKWLLRKFTRNNAGEKIPEDKNVYKNIEDSKLELDGKSAYKVTFETVHPWGLCEKISCASYVTKSPKGGYIRINVYAPAEGYLDKDGNPYRPSIEDLCAIIENTYTRKKP